jgi:tetratricopeptide (TPR) repeat protein
MDEIHRYEGTINQFRGDGVMALFGAPIAHEDHAQRACHAALAVQKVLTPYSENLKTSYGIDFNMRIGLNSGPVVVGSIGDDLRMDYTAQGDTANLAARMESSADPGSILISDNTHRLAKEFFEFGAPSAFQVKGKQEPVEAYRLIKPTEVETRIAASAAKGLTRFVGRTHEIETLKAAFEKVQSGEGQVVGIVGEAGVGKSRLLLEFRNTLPKGEHWYYEGRCLHYGGSMPYLPILDITRSLIGVKEGEQEHVIRQKLKEIILGIDQNLAHVIPPFQELLSLKVDDEDFAKLEPKQKREKAFEAIRDLLIRGSQDRTVVLVVEDLHWIDKTTEEFLGYMIGWLPRTRILLLLLYRPEYTHQWGSKSYYSMIGVGQLSASTSAELVGAILEGGDVVPELRELILNRAAGNPLFMEELTHTLLQNGSIQKKDDQFVLTRDVPSDQVPDTIQGIIAARMDRLEESLKRIMQVAAVIGREFAFRILETITEMKEELKSGLVNLQGLEFIYEKSLFPDLEYIFRHALVQEVAYNSLLINRRKEIHEKIGGAIETLYPARLEEFYEMLAYHYSRSEDQTKAYEYLKLSARKAAEREALWESFGFYSRAADTMSKLPVSHETKRELVQLILSMTAPMRGLGYPEDSFKYFELAEGIAKDVNDSRTSAKVMSLTGLYHVTKGDARLGSVYIENAFREAEKSEDVTLIAPIGFDLCLSHFSKRDMVSLADTPGRILPFIETAHMEREFFGRPPNPYAMIKAMKGFALANLGDFPAAERCLGEALSLATEINHIFTIGHAEACYGMCHMIKGDGQACVDHCQKAVCLLEQINAMLWLGPLYSCVGHGYHLVGRLDDAIGNIEKGLGIHTKIGILPARAIHYLFLSMIYLDMGDMAEASKNAEEARRLATKREEKDLEGRSHIVLGRIAAKKATSQFPDAEHSILNGIKILAHHKLKPYESMGYLHLGELYAESGRKEEALQNLKKAEGMFQDMGMDYWLGKAQEALARL